MLLCITMQKRNILIVSIVLVGVIGMAGFVGDFVQMDSPQNVQDSKQEGDVVKKAPESVSETEMKVLYKLKQEMVNDGYSGVSVRVDPEKDSSLVLFDPVKNPKKNVKDVAVTYADISGEYDYNKPLIIRSSNLEGVVPEVPLQQYNNDSLNREAFRKTVEVRLVR